MRITRTSLLLGCCLALALGCGDACSGSGSSNGMNDDVERASGSNGEESDEPFVDNEGRVCADATPCGNCDHDCRPSGNPFVTGSGSGGDGSGAGGTGTGTGGDGTGGLGGTGGTGDGSGGDGTGGTGTGSGGDGTGGAGGTGTGSGGDGTGGTSDGSGSGSGGSTPDQTVCMDLDVTLERTIPTVVLLIDQSGSMSEGFGNGMNRLEAAYNALMDPVDGLIVELQSSFRIGMALYTSYSRGNTCPELQDVRPEFDNYEPIDRVFSIAEPENDTPTGEAIESTFRMFDIHQDQGRKLLLLATDGEPDTCAVPNPQNGQPEAIAATQQAFQRGIETVVLSVGDEVGRSHLQDMANAGKGLAVGGGTNAPYFQANSPDQLKNQLKGIVQAAQGCTFRINGAVVDPGLLKFSTVTVDGQVVAYDDPNGWIYHQDRKTCHGAKQCIELVGAACDTIQGPGSHAVSGDFLCTYWDPESSGSGSGGDGGTGTGTGSGGTSGGTGSGSGGPGACEVAGQSCMFAGDCCSGICTAGGQGSGICIDG